MGGPWLVIWAALVGAALGAPCAGYMGTFSSTGTTTIAGAFPTTYLAAPVNCTWVFIGGGGAHVIFSLTASNFEPFIFDRVVIYAGVNVTSGPALATYRYNLASTATVYARTPNVTLVAYAEPGKRGARTFTINLSAPAGQPSPCVNGSTTLVTASGYIQPWMPMTSSLAAGYFYAPGTVCRWLITAPSTNDRVFVSLTSTSMGPHDRLTITDVTPRGNFSANVPYNYTSGGAVNTATYGASAGALLVEFAAAPEANIQFRGFVLSATVNAGSGATLCNGEAPLATDSSGYISNISPRLERYFKYQPGSYCAWPIDVGDGNVVRLNGSVYTTLYKDAVCIYDGDSIAAPLIVAQSGTQPSIDVVVSNGSRVLVVFRATSDAIVDSSTIWGFELFYEAVPRDTVTPTLPRPVYNGLCNGDQLQVLYFYDYINYYPHTENGTAGYPPNQYCVFHFKGLEFTSTNVNVGNYLGSGDQINVYAGKDVASGVFVGQITSGDYQTFSLTGTDFVLEFITDGQTTGDGNGFYAYTYSNNAGTSFCLPTSTPAPQPSQEFGYPYVFGQTYGGALYPSNIDCGWLIDVGDDIAISLAFGYFNISLGDQIIVYAGMNASSGRVIYAGNAPSINGPYHARGPIFIRFITDSSPMIYGANGYGWWATWNYQISNGYREGGSTWSFYSPLAFPYPYRRYNVYTGKHDAWWTILAPPGITISAMTFKEFYMAPGDYVYFYDGPNITSPLLARFTYSGVTTFTYPTFFKPTCGNFTVRVVTTGDADRTFQANYGFQLAFTGTTGLPNDACSAWPTQVTCTGARTINNATALAALQACTWLHAGTVTVSNAFTGDIYLPNLLYMSASATITMTNNANIVGNGIAFNFPSLLVMAGTINLANSYFGNVTLPLARFINTITLDTCSGDSQCYYAGRNYVNFQSAVVVNSMTVDSYASGFALPNVQHIGTLLLGSGDQNVSMPNLLYVTVNADISWPSSSPDFSSLIYVEKFNLEQACEIEAPNGTLTFPNLVASNSLFKLDCVQVSEIYLPRLTFVDDLCLYSFFNCDAYRIIDLSALTVGSPDWSCVDYVSFPALRVVHTSLQVYSSSTKAWSFPVLSGVNGQISLSYMPLVRALDVPQLRYAGCISYNGGIPFVRNLTFESLRSAYIRMYDNNGVLQYLNVPNLVYSDELQLQSSGLLSVELPSALLINCLELGPTGQLISFSAPQLIATYDFRLSGSPVLKVLSVPRVREIRNPRFDSAGLTTMEMPSLTGTYYTFCVSNLPNLVSLYTCGLVGSRMSITNTPKLSCDDISAAYGFLGSDLTVNGCDATTKAVFGCIVNVTHTVNATLCGFTLPCVQSMIDATYGNGGQSIVLPPGTYTNCTTPLTFRGKDITLRGGDGNATVIDCEGAGTAFAFVNGETSNTVVAHLTITRASSLGSGGAVVISTSPTLIDVNFVNNEAAAGGGAVVISGGIPSFQNCIFEENTAGSGGAILLRSGGSMLLQGCEFYRNYAASSGGAIDVQQTSQVVVIAGANTFVENTAVLGGAIYAESSVSIVGGAHFDGNVAEIGGAVAMLPIVSSGTTLALNQVAFAHNAATSGGALYLYGTALNMNETLLMQNNATIEGGALFAMCSEVYRTSRRVVAACPLPISITSSQFMSNQATAGTGGAIATEHVQLNIAGSTVESNVACTDGGALHVTTSNLTVSNSFLRGNAAGAFGGAVYCDAAGTCAVTQSDVAENVAGYAGGAVFLCYSACTFASVPPSSVNLLGSTLSSNHVSEGGYGNITATDPAAMYWRAPPKTEVISGATLAQAADGMLRASLSDHYGQTITSGLQAVAMSIVSPTVTGVTLTRQTTVLVENGAIVFESTALIAATTAQTNTTYRLILQHSLIPAVSLTDSVTLLSCQPGQGNANANADGTLAASGLLCRDCPVGARGNVDKSRACVTCLGGTVAPLTRSTECTPCANNTFQPAPGATLCISCPSNTHSGEGATECEDNPPPPAPPPTPPTPPPPPSVAAAAIIQTPAAAGMDPATLYGIIGGIVVFLICLMLIVGRCIYRQTRRKTMEKYYLDEDTTIRQGTADSKLMTAVKKMIGATTTTRIGGGQFSDVYRARYNNDWIALKVLKGESIGNSTAHVEFQREVVALSLLDPYKHPAIIELRFFLEKNPTCIALPFCAAGSLKRRKREPPLTDLEKVKMAAHVASAVALIHAKNIAHMDIKTDNILITEDGQVKLADFGICKLLGDAGSSSPHGSITSVSPGNNNNNAHASVTQTSVNPIFGSEHGAGSVDSMDGGMELNGLSFAGSANGMAMPQQQRHGSLAASMFGNLGSVTLTESNAFTPQYVDPHLLLNEFDRGDETLKRADVFAYAMVMWAIWSEDEPFAGVEPQDLMRQRRANPGMRPTPALVNCHGCYAELLERAWDVDPLCRPTMTDCVDHLAMCLSKHFNHDLPAVYRDIPATAPPAPRLEPSFASAGAPSDSVVSSMAFIPGGTKRFDTADHVMFDSTSSIGSPSQAAQNRAAAPSDFDSMYPPPPPPPENTDSFAL